MLVPSSAVLPDPLPRAFGLAALVGCVLATAAFAQELRGRIVAADGLDQPIEGAMVTLLDTAGNRVKAAFTNDLGVFRVTADSAGTFSVRVERIGFERWDSDPLDLGLGAPLIVEFEIPIQAIRLADLDVEVARQCVDDPRGATEIGLVWEEVRKALESQLLAETMELFRFSSVVFDRTVTRRGNDILAVQTFGAQGLARAPFRSLEAERLSGEGYIQQEGETVYYYAPDATVLLSNTFQADHCFGLEREDRDDRVMLGLTFEPRDGRELPDISGVLWVDEETNALDHVEFRYENIPFRGVSDRRIAGIVEYGRLPTGAFIVRDWYIRMPNLVQGRGDRFSIDGFKEYGGELRHVSEPEGGAVEWRVGAGVNGMIVDPTTGRPLRNATLILDLPKGDDEVRHTGPNGEFFFDGLQPGKYRLEVRHGLFDAIDASRPRVDFELEAGERYEALIDLPGAREILVDLCGDETDGTVVIVGRISDETRRFPVNRARVWAEWTELRESTEPGDNHGRVVVESDETRTNGNGYYALCDVPVGLDIALHAVDSFAGSGATRVRTARPVNVADIAIRWPRSSGR